MQLSCHLAVRSVVPTFTEKPVVFFILVPPSLLVLGNKVGNVFALPDLESWSVCSCSLMNNKYTYSEAQQPPLFKPSLPAKVRLVADFTCILEKCVVVAGPALRQQFQAQAPPGCDALAGRGQEKATGPSLTWRWDEPPPCQFYFIAKINKSYFHSHVFIWGSPSEGTEMN